MLSNMVMQKIGCSSQGQAKIILGLFSELVFHGKVLKIPTPFKTSKHFWMKVLVFVNALTGIKVHYVIQFDDINLEIGTNLGIAA